MGKRHLITGSTGATGGHVVDRLLEAGHGVRALVRADDDRASALRRRGVEVVVGDLLDADAVSRALTDIDSAYLVYPIGPGLIDVTVRFAQAARERGVGHVVNMSQISARPDADSLAARGHWLAERVIDWAGLPVTHLRPTFFAEWLFYSAPTIRKGVLQTPMSTGRHAPIAAKDQASVIAAILKDPTSHAGATYPLFGPVEMTHDEIAATVGGVLGRDVVHRTVSVEDYGRMIGAPGDRLDAAGRPWSKSDVVTGRAGSWYLLQHLEEVAKDHTGGRFAGTNDVVRRIGGVEPTTVARFVEENRAVFA